MNTGSGSGSSVAHSANQRTIESYTSPARTSGEAGEGDEQAVRTEMIAASTTLRLRTATNTPEQYHSPCHRRPADCPTRRRSR